jgi:hypothetical protein
MMNNPKASSQTNTGPDGQFPWLRGFEPHGKQLLNYFLAIMSDNVLYGDVVSNLPSVEPIFVRYRGQASNLRNRSKKWA